MEPEPPIAVARSGVRSRLLGLRARARGVPAGALAWRIGITLIGLAVIAVGVLLLPLPGPGWLIIFAGLGLLSTEYDWAAQLLIRARRMVARWSGWAARQPTLTRVLVGILAFASLAAFAFGSWYVYMKV